MRMLLLALCLFSLNAIAACEATFTTTGSFNGAERLTQTTVYKGLDQAGVDLLYAKGLTIVNVAAKEQDKAKKGASHAIDFTRQTKCDGQPGKEPESIRVEGLTWQGVAKVARQAAKVQFELTKAGDDHVAKGNKTGWGK